MTQLNNEWEFPLYPIPDVPNANGVVYPRALLEKAIVDVQARIDDRKFFVAPSAPRYDALGTITLMGRVLSIELGRDGNTGTIRVNLLPTYDKAFKDAIVMSSKVSFGLVTASSVRNLFDRREYPPETKMVVEVIENILTAVPFDVSTKQPVIISEERIVTEARIQE